MKTTKKSSQDCTPPPGNHWVFGAGGWNIFHHLGVLKAADELGINRDDALGVSAGSLVSAFDQNGYSWDVLLTELLKMLEARENPVLVAQAFRPADPLSMAIGGWFSLLPFMRGLVNQFKLDWTDGLRILACDILRHEPVVLKKGDCDLATAIVASGAVPGGFQPVWLFKDGRWMLLVDGAVYHYNPTEFNCGTAIVSKFRPATQLPKEWKTPLDLYFHMRELYFPLAGNQRYVDDTHNVVIENGMPDVAGLNGGLSRETCLQMVDNGYNTGLVVLKEALAEGRIVANAKPGLH